MCVVGVDHSELVSLAEKHFGNLSVGYEDGVIPLLEPCRYTGSEVSQPRHGIPLPQQPLYSKIRNCRTDQKVLISIHVSFYLLLCLFPCVVARFVVVVLMQVVSIYSLDATMGIPGNLSFCLIFMHMSIRELVNSNESLKFLPPPPIFFIVDYSCPYWTYGVGRPLALTVLDDLRCSVINLYYLCNDPDIHKCTC